MHCCCKVTKCRHDKALHMLQNSGGLAQNLKQIASSLSAAPSSQAQTSEQVGFHVKANHPLSLTAFTLHHTTKLLCLELFECPSQTSCCACLCMHALLCQYLICDNVMRGCCQASYPILKAAQVHIANSQEQQANCDMLS